MYGEAGDDTFQFDLSNVTSINVDSIDGGPNRDTTVFNGGNFDGNPTDATVFPGEVQVDYVRVYQH